MPLLGVSSLSGQRCSGCNVRLIPAEGPTTAEGVPGVVDPGWGGRSSHPNAGMGSAGVCCGLGVDGDGVVGQGGSEVVGDDLLGDTGGAVGAGVGTDGEVAGDDDGVALGEAVGGVFGGLAEDGDPVVGGRSIDPVALVVAGAV